MAESPRHASVSLFFFAGDFVDVLRRYAAGEEQIYATHDEVARLIQDLRDAGVRVTVYSFVTARVADETPLDGVRIVSLGASGYTESARLTDAMAADTSEAIVAHFPNDALLRAVIATGRPAYAGLANSYNRRGIKTWVQKWRTARILNDPAFQIVSNHCLPATRQIAGMGVKRDKLVPWDIPHRFRPHDFAPKELAERTPFTLAYAGSIAEDKGVGDLIRAVARLRAEGVELACTLAGLGQIEAMRALAAERGVADLIDLRGIIANGEVFAHFAGADVVAVPSRREYPEGFPLTMFEAIASRTPIVCTDHPMFRPVMRDGVNAAVFASGDDAAFAAALKRVLTDPALYASLSNNAEATWAALEGPADWRTLIRTWVVEGAASDWIARRKLSATG